MNVMSAQAAPVVVWPVLAAISIETSAGLGQKRIGYGP